MKREIIKRRIKDIIQAGGFSIGQRIDYQGGILKPLEAEGYSSVDIRDTVFILISEEFLDRYTKYDDEIMIEDAKLTPKGLKEWIEKINNQKELRCAVLEVHYQLSQANTLCMVSRQDVANALGFDGHENKELLNLILFLEEKKLLHAVSNIEDSITAEGIDEVEEGFPILLRKGASNGSVSISVNGANNGNISSAGNTSSIDNASVRPRPFVDFFGGGFSHEGGDFGRRISPELHNLGNLPAINIKARVESDNKENNENLIPESTIPTIDSKTKTPTRINFNYTALKIGNIVLTNPRIVFYYNDIDGKNYRSSRSLIQIPINRADGSTVFEIRAGDLLMAE